MMIYFVAFRPNKFMQIMITCRQSRLPKHCRIIKKDAFSLESKFFIYMTQMNIFKKSKTFCYEFSEYKVAKIENIGEER